MVKLLVIEDGTKSMIELVEGTEDRHKFASVLALVEVRSAIRRRQFAGDTHMSDADRAIRILDAESKRMVQHPVTSPVLRLAEALVDRQNLRALDSVQLATAILAREGLPVEDAIRFVASDRKLLDTAAAEGFAIWNPAE